ncbi:MAG: AAA family ATPase [Nitrososphaerota archaeon]|nr:AAA family ATPase [Nitrososphaerota archaeon]MDG7052070.1 AAA family ATPase [Nitrososphaerota archaeon]
MKNYRQYGANGKPQKVELSTSNKNFTVIEGPNGSGKTNLLNAISWCLYGKEPYLSRISKGKSMDKINIKAINELENGKTLDMFVSVTLGDLKPQYVVTRSLVASKDTSGEVKYTELPENPKVMYLEGHDWKDHPQPNYLINKLLPEEISGFFLFDGERLDDFFREENAEGVRTALINVSQINLIDSALGRLDSVKTKLRNGIRGQIPQADVISQRIESYKIGREAATKQSENLEIKKKGIIKDIQSIDDELKGIPREDIQKLEKERKDIDEELIKSENEINEKEERIIDLIINTGPKIYALPALTNTQSKINDIYKSGELPPKIRETFIKELLEKGECICGTDISKPGPQRTNVEKHLHPMSFSSIADEINNGRYELGSLIKNANSFADDIDEPTKDLRRLKENWTSMTERKKEISTKLETDNAPRVSQLESRRRELDGEKGELDKEIGGLLIQIEGYNSGIRQYEKDYRKEIDKEEKYATLVAQIDLCGNAINILETAKQELIGEIRKVIEEKTKKYFFELIWKKDTYNDVKIDENYSLSVINKDGWNAAGALSAGEREILALSFMAALKEVSGFNAPVIIDTPLGRISGETKENIAGCLPNYLPGVQVTLLMTDQEYTDSIRKRLNDRVGLEWRLEYDEKREVTEVVKYAK